MTSNGTNGLSDAIMFSFPDSHSASLAYATLQELGYAPVRHEGGELHVHLRKGDLTSALEIAMAYGGQPLERQGIAGDSLYCSAYDMDAITIPAHLVNEEETTDGDDAVAFDPPHALGGAETLRYRDEDGAPPDSYLPTHDDYGFFSGDVRA